MQNFNSSVWQWFQDAIGKPTEAQQQAWPAIKEKKNTLISAPTGSGKTLSAFFSIIDDLIQKGLEGSLEEKTYVVYVSPLKALSNDIEKNLRLPIRGLKERLEVENQPAVHLSVGLRTGSEGAAVRRGQRRT